MKLLALMLAFACYADAKADMLIPGSDNFVISTKSARLAATGFGKTKNDGVIVYNVYDCFKGYGDIDVHVAYVNGTDQGLTHITTTQWSSTGTSIMNRAATYICATALAKEGLLK